VAYSAEHSAVPARFITGLACQNDNLISTHSNPFHLLPHTLKRRSYVAIVGASSRRSVDKVDREADTESTLAPSERSRSRSRASHNSERRQGQGQEQEQGHGQEQRWRKGHYRGITFDDILPPHLITSAPPPGAEQKQTQTRGGRGRPKSAEVPSKAATTSTIPSTSEPRSSTTKHSYPSVKHSGGKSRIHATARALVRRLTLAPKRDSRRRGGYEAV
jgi:hypothetical protein